MAYTVDTPSDSNTTPNIIPGGYWPAPGQSVIFHAPDKRPGELDVLTVGDRRDAVIAADGFDDIIVYTKGGKPKTFTRQEFLQALGMEW